MVEIKKEFKIVPANTLLRFFYTHGLRKILRKIIIKLKLFKLVLIDTETKTIIKTSRSYRELYELESSILKRYCNKKDFFNQLRRGINNVHNH